jgi:hypothetical protein
MRTAPGFPALPPGSASAAHGLLVAVDPSAASFRTLALQVRADRDEPAGGLLTAIVAQARLSGAAWACSRLPATEAGHDLPTVMTRQ